MLANDEWINVVPALPPAPPRAPGVPLVIFDSGMSSEYDDVGDCAVLEGSALLGECHIIGMANSSTNGATALCMDAINTYYGCPDVPIGVRPDVGGNGAYPAQIAAEFPHVLQSSRCAELRTVLTSAVAAVTHGTFVGLYQQDGRSVGKTGDTHCKQVASANGLRDFELGHPIDVFARKRPMTI